MYANVFFILYSFWVQQKQIAYVIRVIERLCTTIKKNNEAGFTDLFNRPFSDYWERVINI